MRTPKRPGRYTPGSTVTTLPPRARSDQDEILDAYAEALWKVHARLDGDDIARDELASDAVAEARLLVDVDADAVARAVVEELAVAALGDHAPRRLVHLLAVLPGADERQRGFLRGQHGLVDVHHLRLARAGRERAGAVGAVAADERARGRARRAWSARSRRRRARRAAARRWRPRRRSARTTRRRRRARVRAARSPRPPRAPRGRPGPARPARRRSRRRSRRPRGSARSRRRP